MDGGEERGCIFGVSRGNTAPAFEVEEGVFNQMPRFVKVGVVGALFFAVFLGRNDGLHALTFCPFKNFIRNRTRDQRADNPHASLQSTLKPACNPLWYLV